mmetsp:Transcript_36661/g.44818  ORF Transcript_36661/g.44818 Transcript_36661/m.44818 type:complete len:487 (+) Transcript_36661:94-1554(+)
MTSESSRCTETPSGLVDTWKLWRHCLCRHGWYPILIAPVVTCACVMDLYASRSCDFMKVNVGFEPTNDVWNSATAEIGFWSYQSGNYETVRDYKNLYPGCMNFSQEFTDYFIGEDKVWTAVRIMSMASDICGLIGVCAIWIITICPLPTWIMWPGVLLPSILISLLGSGAKFFFLDADICQGRIWRTVVDGEEGYVKAASCELGNAAYFTLGAVSCYFLCIILIFYRVPEKRTLDSKFGVRNKAPYNDVEDVFCVNGEEIAQEEYSDSSESYDIVEPRSYALDYQQRSIYDDDGVEAVMAQIGEYFKATDGEYLPNPDEFVPELPNMEMVEMGQSDVFNVQGRHVERTCSKEQHQLSKEKEQFVSQMNNVLVPSKSYRNKENQLEQSNDNEDRSSSSLVSKLSMKSGSQSRKSGRDKSSQMAEDLNQYPQGAGENRRISNEEQMMHVSGAGENHQSNILDDLLSPKYVTDAANKAPHTPRRRFRAY